MKPGYLNRQIYRSSNKIRVLHIITRLIIGGAQENTLLTLIGLQQKNNYEISLISGPTFGPEGSLEAKAKACTNLTVIPELRRNINPVLDIIAFYRLYLFIKKFKFDIVHTHSSKAGIIGRLAAKLAGAPIIIHTIHGLPFYPGQNFLLNALYIFLEKFTSRFTNKLICVSDTIIRDALCIKLAAKEKFIRIYSGIELEKFVAKREIKNSIREQLKIPIGSMVVGKVARLFHRKGHEYLLQAAVKIKQKIPQIKILLVGDGILKATLLQQAKRLKIDDCLIFAGLISPDDIPLYMQAIDILVHVSLHEGLPRSVIQAFVLGIPAVCFDVDGAGEVIKNGKNGFLIPPKNIDRLAECLIELLQNKNEITEMGQKARHVALDNFSASKMVDDIDNLYKNLKPCFI